MSDLLFFLSIAHCGWLNFFFFHGLILFYFILFDIPSYFFSLSLFFLFPLFPFCGGLHDTTNGVNRVLGVTRKTDAYLPIPSGAMG